jgi:hypothetical protein
MVVITEASVAVPLVWAFLAQTFPLHPTPWLHHAAAGASSLKTARESNERQLLSGPDFTKGYAEGSASGLVGKREVLTRASVEQANL